MPIVAYQKGYIGLLWVARFGAIVRCSFPARIILHSRIPLVPTPARLKRCHACDPMAFLSGVHYLLPFALSVTSHRQRSPTTRKIITKVPFMLSLHGPIPLMAPCSLCGRIVRSRNAIEFHAFAPLETPTHVWSNVTTLMTSHDVEGPMLRACFHGSPSTLPPPY
jgi:hypothetical protein